MTVWDRTRGSIHPVLRSSKRASAEHPSPSRKEQGKEGELRPEKMIYLNKGRRGYRSLILKNRKQTTTAIVGVRKGEEDYGSGKRDREIEAKPPYSARGKVSIQRL